MTSACAGPDAGRAVAAPARPWRRRGPGRRSADDDRRGPALAGDYLSYHQDAIGTEAYLATARRRLSVVRHARLLDYFLVEGCNARTWLALTVAAICRYPLPPWR